MQRRKTSVWTPDTDPRARRQKCDGVFPPPAGQENQPPEKESQPQSKTQAAAGEVVASPRHVPAQESKPHMAGRLATDKAKPKPKPEVKPETPAKPAPDEPKEVAETKAEVKKSKPKRKPLRLGRRPRAPIGDQRAIAYFDKQVREKTEMVFIGYGETVDCTIIMGLVFEWILSISSGGAQTSESGGESSLTQKSTHNDERDRRKKTDFCCCYKQREAEKVKATMVTDLAIVNQKLEPIIPRKDRYKVNDEILKTSRSSKSPITVALRTGQVFTGIVDWFARYDIALILSNGGKVKIFRHGLYNVKVDAPVVKDEGSAN
ncbi:hypothetical protein IH992_17720 [Candidatus Poribacteria bacterium]|nr:hypothetical protein [Candidatus Poribacteria bacterium]